MVEHRRHVRTDKDYEMKAWQKAKLSQMKQKHVAVREMRALWRISAAGCPYVQRLHATISDRNQVYILLDYVPYGDVWSLLYRDGFEHTEFVFRS